MPIAPRGHALAEISCRALASSLPWSQRIIDEWPVVIAYEYWRLREELSEGRAYAAMLQFKDLLELLIKLPALVAARLLVEHGSAEQRQQALDALLSPRPLTLGAWCERARDLAPEAATLAAAAAWAGVLGLHARPGGRMTPLFNHAQHKAIGWRNNELAHGALKLDLSETMSEFGVQLQGLVQLLAAHETAFDTVRLQPAGTGIDLSGAGALDSHTALATALGDRPMLPLTLVCGGDQIDFGPYLCLRRGRSGTGEVLCYLLNKRLKTRRIDGLHLLDYQTGFTAEAAVQEFTPTMAAEFEAVPWRDDDPTQAEGADTRDKDVRIFLDQVSFTREYVPPDYLRNWIKGFATDPARDRGIAWLRGPGDVGKTLFALGLDTQGARGIGQAVLGEAMPRRLAPNLHVLVVPLRKEYRCTPLSLGWEVQLTLGRAEDRGPLSLGTYLKDASSKPAAFADWLSAIRDESVAHLGPSNRLLLVIDALDEIPPPNADTFGGSIHELLLPAQALPERVFLLLTSRDRGGAAQDDCPAFVFNALQRAVEASEPDLRTEYRLDPRLNIDYRAVLQAYFSEQLSGRPSFEQSQGAAFEQALAAADHRFKQLSYFTALLRDGAVNPSELASLSEQPLAAHLAALERHEPAKRFDLTRRIILHLAAAEEAHLAEVRFMEPTPVGLQPQWLGLDLMELARRVGYPSEHARALDPRFVSALYGMGTLLRSYRGDAADRSRFALGLKGMQAQLEQLEGWHTHDLHWATLWEAFGDFNQAQDDMARAAALLRAAGPARALVDKGAEGLLGPEQASEIDDIVTRIGQSLVESSMLHSSAIRLAGLGAALFSLATDDDAEPGWRANQIAAWFSQRGIWRGALGQSDEAIADYGRAIELREGLRELLGAQWPPAFRNDLAGAYMNRGVAHGDNNALAEAIADYGRAIELMEGLRELLGAQWPPAFRNDLAAAYMNRGVAHSNNNALAEAIADYGRAIELREGLRELLGAQWPPAFRNDLAAAYMNRGNAHSNNNALAEAIADYGRAIELREGLRELLGAQWPPAFRNDLAGAYMNRGVAHGDNNALAEAIADYGRAIELREGLRELLGAQWPPAFRNDLAAAYMNRGNAHSNNNALAEAIADYGRAIELREGLRELLGAQWPPAFRNDLAGAYMNRGVAHRNNNALAEAIADYGRAIELREGLRELLGAQWPPAFRNDLAAAYMNRGVAHSNNNALAEAIADYGRAIELREGLRELLGAQWPPAFRNDLAGAYMNRGVAHRNNNALAEAIADYGRAIELREGLRELLGAQWPPAFRNDLAGAYMNRGNAHGDNNALAEAIADYGRAIELREGLRELLGAQWPPAFRNDLAGAYMNRGVAHGDNNALAEAIADYGRAIELMEGLRELLGAQWPPAWRERLASGYRNRALVLDQLKDAAGAARDRQRADTVLSTDSDKRS